MTMILFYACVFSMYLAYHMKTYYSPEYFKIMWHDDYSMATTVLLFLMIVSSTGGYAQFSKDSIRIRQLIKFDHFYEFEQEKMNDSQFQILKQETMKIDNKLMTIDQNRFDVLALQINEDDSLCRPDCIPLIYNITISSIHGNIDINLPADKNFKDSSL